MKMFSSYFRLRTDSQKCAADLLDSDTWCGSGAVGLGIGGTVVAELLGRYSLARAPMAVPLEPLVQSCGAREEERKAGTGLEGGGSPAPVNGRPVP